MVSNAALANRGCLQSCSCGSGYMPLWPLSLCVAPTAPPVGSYDVGGHDTSVGATSFQKAARFKSNGSGTNTISLKLY